VRLLPDIGGSRDCGFVLLTAFELLLGLLFVVTAFKMEAVVFFKLDKISSRANERPFC
jgi:hypothetical protein